MDISCDLQWARTQAHFQGEGKVSLHGFEAMGHYIVSQARPSHSTAFSSFRINTRREEGLAHCLDPRLRFDTLRSRDVIQTLTQKCWPWKHKGTTLKSDATFSIVEKCPNCKFTSQNPRHSPALKRDKNLTWRNHIFHESDWPDKILSGGSKRV
jgi:hypothetical protein